MEIASLVFAVAVVVGFFGCVLAVIGDGHG